MDFGPRQDERRERAGDGSTMRWMRYGIEDEVLGIRGKGIEDGSWLGGSEYEMCLRAWHNGNRWRRGKDQQEDSFGTPIAV